MKYRKFAFEDIFLKKNFQNVESARDDVDTGGDKPQDKRTAEQLLTENDQIRTDLVNNATDTAGAEAIANTQEAQLKNVDSQKLQEIQQVIEGTKEELGTVIVPTFENFFNETTIFGNKVDRQQAFSNINKGSLVEILSRVDINNLHSQIEEVMSRLEVDSKGEQVYGFQEKIGFGVISDIQKIVESLGYKADGIFGIAEGRAISRLIKETKTTQDTIGSASFSDKMKILFDFDMNGALDNNMNFNAKELEAINSIKDEKTLNNFLTNLGIEPSSFNGEISQNYFGARENLKSGIARFAEYKGTSLNQLLLPKDLFDKSMEFVVNKNLNEAANLEGQVSDQVDQLIKEKNIQVSDEVRKQAITLITGAINGAGYTTDTVGKKVSELTNGFLNNVSVGYANGQFGLVIGGSKELGDRVNVSGGLANFIPFVNINGTIVKHEQDVASKSTMFATDMENGLNLDANASASIGIVGAGLSIQRVNESTSSGIREMVGNMSSTLDKLLTEPIKSFEDFCKESGITPDEANKKSYDTIIKAFNSYGNKEPSEFKAGIMRAYQNKLYSNAEGINFTGISFNMIGPILLGGVGFEKISQEYNKKNTREVDTFIKDIVDGYNKEQENRTVEVDVSKKMENFDKDSLDKVNTLGKTISDMIDVKNISKLGNLEHAIHDLLNGEKFGKIDAVWNLFSNEMKKLGKNISILNPANDNEKYLILQSVGINLMKKEGLQMGADGKISLENGKSIEKYDTDKKRMEYFGKIFENNFPALNKNINAARKTFYEQFGKNSSYEIGQMPIDGGIGFTGVEIGSGKSKKDTVNPYVAGHLATFDGKLGKVEITDINPEGITELVNKLPNHFITPLILQLEASGFTFSEGDKISEMKKILIKGKAGDITIDRNVYFAKAAECLNDMVLMDFTLKYKGKEITPGEKLDFTPMTTNAANNKVTGMNFMHSVNTEKPKTSEPEEPKEEEPKKDKPPKEGEPTKPNEPIKPEPPTTTDNPPGNPPTTETFDTIPKTKTFETTPKQNFYSANKGEAFKATYEVGKHSSDPNPKNFLGGGNNF